MTLTHASFFSGVGGVDMGLESAGWQTVSVCEIEPFASAVLARHWPGVANLGDISSITDIPAATLWTGGFPCQDLSNAGKRRGFTHDNGDRTRSGLAFAFLDLVERYRPPAFILENVPGLLSSSGGLDLYTLFGEVVELGYGVAYRTLDARHFGVPQRRRRVFILALRSGADDPDGHLASLRAAEVLSVGTRCDRHPATGGKARARAAAGAAIGAGGAIAGALTRRYGKGVNTTADDGGGDDLVGTLTPGAHPGSYNGQDAYTGHLLPVGSPQADPRGV
ncbi:MAG TPA: DNA (cytosine-5-)-methyltransferase [Propionicimonas sp.]|jgi:DNA (cytosine-5)-methyltransferase 1